MIRLSVLLFTLAGPAGADGLDLSDAERAAFGREVRAAILADPGPIDRALNPPPPDLYSENVAADHARLSDNADLFLTSKRGFGSDDPRLTIVFFETYPCANCAAAWADLETLLRSYPDIRVEPRFSEDSGAAQLLLSILDHKGVAAYRAARAALLQATTDDALAEAIEDGGWPQDRMLRPAPRVEGAAFQALELQEAPAYVFPGMMLQGAMPPIVLEKYLAE